MVISERGNGAGSAGVQTFRVYLPEATSVELVGTFTGWRERPVAMHREGTGWWTATLDLAPGDHEFNYLVGGSHWLADYAASGVKRNGYGGWVSQLHVAAERPTIEVRHGKRSLAAHGT